MVETAKGRPVRADARRNYDRILDAARDAFTEVGPDVPLDVIARRAGIGNATLYRHFPTRELLMEATYRSDVAELAMSAQRLLGQLPPRQALECWVREHFIPAQQHHGFAVMLRDALINAPEVFTDSKQQLDDAVNQLVAAAHDSGDIRREITPRDILRMAYGIAIAFESAPEACDRILAVMFDGLRPA
ncbi:TetR/AcrR family transcriptional regulator [Nocardia sp. NPDC056100]|uniref:TetR/AcrR family transcriptional regulator n=1 Tax=Nocardia sp. NPDC056100 TaxID=3345712 RepID=UPI0035E2E7B0